jgi:Rad3-related DNA helicase
MKYPMPDISDVVLKTMRRFLGNKIFWSYLRDMSDRNLVQQCGRAIRSKNDWCEVYTLDAKVLERLPHLWRGKYVIKKFSIQEHRDRKILRGPLNFENTEENEGQESKNMDLNVLDRWINKS